MTKINSEHNKEKKRKDSKATSAPDESTNKDQQEISEFLKKMQTRDKLIKRILDKLDSVQQIKK